jgi:hypothetical protein
MRAHPHRPLRLSQYSTGNPSLRRAFTPSRRSPFVWIFSRRAAQNENDNPPSTHRAACAKYSVLPSLETNGR